MYKRLPMPLQAALHCGSHHTTSNIWRCWISMTCYKLWANGIDFTACWGFARITRFWSVANGETQVGLRWDYRKCLMMNNRRSEERTNRKWNYCMSHADGIGARPNGSSTEFCDPTNCMSINLLNLFINWIRERVKENKTGEADETTEDTKKREKKTRNMICVMAAEWRSGCEYYKYWFRSIAGICPTNIGYGSNSISYPNEKAARMGKKTVHASSLAFGLEVRTDIVPNSITHSVSTSEMHEMYICRSHS